VEGSSIEDNLSPPDNSVSIATIWKVKLCPKNSGLSYISQSSNLAVEGIKNVCFELQPTVYTNRQLKHKLSNYDWILCHTLIGTYGTAFVITNNVKCTKHQVVRLLINDLTPLTGWSGYNSVIVRSSICCTHALKRNRTYCECDLTNRHLVHQINKNNS